ncbi:unnamed protein product [Schistosoma haematobium]|nr:unnamed protein product [Schistosoma haematobium]
MNVPGKWIQSVTLVEYEALGDCPKHNSTEACHGATTLNTRCIWCETANMCITSNDEDIHEFKVNGCKNNSLDVNAPIELKTPATNELKKTSPSNESHLERKSLSYVYIVVPLVICFLIVCIGCGIWLWFYRRERVHQWFSQIASQFSSSR